VAAIVSSDIACDLIKGKTLDQALKLENTQILDVMGEIPPNKVHCSILAKEAIEAAVKDFRKKKERAKKGK
jgi:nitrogen fixation NifU-like protein